MEFEKEFPEFKGHQYMYFSWNALTGEFPAVPAIHRNDIMEHCLSKQRLNEAIDKVNSVRNDRVIRQGFEDLLDELGIE